MRFETPDGPKDFTVRNAIVAGWTGRDRSAVDHHIEELAALGVAPPSRVPLFYRVSASLLTQSENIQVLGPDTSGEAEPFLLRQDGAFWLGLASDHTDRALETVSVAASKQICPKPVAKHVWPMSEVHGHLDEIALTCEIEKKGNWTPYQEGSLASIRRLDDLISEAELQDGSAMLCGTLAAIGGVRPAARYRMTLSDPVQGRSIELNYAVTALPQVS